MKVCFILFLFVPSLQINSQTTDCGIQWEAAMQLSPNNANAYSPRMVAQGDTIHLVFSGFGKYHLPFVRSLDGGMTWQSMRNILDTTMFPNIIGRPFPATDGQDLYVFFIGGIDGTGDSPIFMIKSSDRGDTWSAAQAITGPNGYIQNVAVLGDTIAIVGYVYPILNDWIISSTNGGTTWSLVEFPFYTNDPRVSLSKGWLHLAYTYYTEGCSFEQFYRRSSNLGVSWSDSVLLSTCDNKSGSRTYIVSSPEGNLGVSWTDSKYGCAGFIGCSILFKRSSDNGVTWSGEQILTETPWGDISVLSYASGNLLSSWPGGVGVESRLSTNNGVTWSNLCSVIDTGGYPGNTVSTTRALLAWERGGDDESTISVRSGVLPTMSVVGSPKEMPLTFKMYKPFPNPFNSGVTFRYELATRSRIHMRIYNTLGEQVAYFDRGEQDRGEYSVVWQADEYSSGLYLYVATAGNNVQTGKVMVLR